MWFTFGQSLPSHLPFLSFHCLSVSVHSMLFWICFKEVITLHSTEEVRVFKLFFFLIPVGNLFRGLQIIWVWGWRPSLVRGIFPQASFYYLWFILCILCTAFSLGCAFRPQFLFTRVHKSDLQTLAGRCHCFWPNSMGFHETSLLEHDGIFYTYIFALSYSGQMWFISEYNL